MAGAPKIALPMTTLTKAAVRSHRPMTRTRAGREGTGGASTAEAEVPGKGLDTARILRDGGRPAFKLLNIGTWHPPFTMPKARNVAMVTLVLAALLTAPVSLPAAPKALPELAGTAGVAADPLAAEIDRWSKRLAAEASADPLWSDVKGAAGPVLTRAQEALRDDRRLLALLRLAAARENLAAGVWLLERPQEVRKNMTAFEGEWARMGASLGPSLGVPSVDELAGVSPALARALGEAARHQVRVYYDASLEYGRNTTPDSGLFYLGAAKAQAEFAALAQGLGAATPPLVAAEVPGLRALGPELDALESEMLAAYRPPASVDRHPQFIAASSALKIARELDAAGLRYGALLRYLQAILRFAAVREPGPLAIVFGRLLRRAGLRSQARREPAAPVRSRPQPGPGIPRVGGGRASLGPGRGCGHGHGGRE